MRPSSQLEFDLSGFFRTCDQGIAQEMRASQEALTQARLAKGLGVYDGVAVDDLDHDAGRTGFVYAFRYKDPITVDDTPLELPTGAACAFSREGGAVRANGRVRHHDVEGRRVTVALDASIGEGGGLAGFLSFDLQYLLENLAEHLREIREGLSEDSRRTGAVDAFVRGRWAKAQTQLPALPSLPDSLAALNLNPFQAMAVQHCLGNAHHLVWGPPGTGKTRTLGAAVLARLGREPDARLLVVAHTNVALDNAIGAIWKNFQILRPGASREDFLDEVGLHRVGRALDEDVTEVADALHDQLLQADESLAAFAQTLEGHLKLYPRGSMRQRASQALRHARIQKADGKSSPELDAAATHLEERLRELESASIRTCRVLCCTLSQVDLRRGLLRELPWSAAFVDEVSMVGIARALPVADLAGTFLGFGDFQQLSPIVRSSQSDARRVLGEDLFTWLGAADPREDDPRRTMLAVQYRMKPEICEPVSHHFYGDKLETHPSVLARPTRFRFPVFGVYTDGLNPKNAQAGKSKANEVHAQVIATLVESLWREGVTDIGVVTPYSAQAERIRALVPSSIRGEVDVSTVHRYQGREKDVIVFDSMIAGGEPAEFLSTQKNPGLRKLLNVALSRARDALFVVLDQESARNSALWSNQDLYVDLVEGLANTLPEDMSDFNQFAVDAVPSTSIDDFVSDALTHD